MWFGTGTFSKIKADASWGKFNLSFLHINFINHMSFLLVEKIEFETQGWLTVIDVDSCNALVNYFHFCNEHKS